MPGRTGQTGGQQVDADQHTAAAERIERELLAECDPVARRRIFARAAVHRAAAREQRERAHYAATGELLGCRYASGRPVTRLVSIRS